MAAVGKWRHACEATSAPSAPSKRPAARHSTYRYDVPLLVTVVGGNAVTAAAVLGCLDTADATALRRLHPILVAHVAAIAWSDTTTRVRDPVRWRAAFPAAVGCNLGRFGRSAAEAAIVALRGVTVLDLNRNDDVTDAVVAALPPTLRRLNVLRCRRLTHDVSFTHLPALEWLDCSTKSIESSALPPSLRELVFMPYGVADFSHLRSLRVL